VIAPLLAFACLAVAGGIGAVARYALDTLVRSRVSSVLPIGTMLINVSGSLALGFLTGLVLFHAVPDDWRLVAGTGFLGGYTTFSTASFETIRLLQQRRMGAALVAGVGTLVLAVAAAAAGFGLAAIV
jgi:fluoride exporter